ncbi:MAG TPA: zf-TFIIB domain-containing protein [Paraburkholderia sp.]|jgi:hypothetical protein
MKCPVCKTTDLLMTERRSIEIDYCPVCRGVWLDRGELDKLIAQDVEDNEASSNARDNRNDRDDQRERERDKDHAYENDRNRGYNDNRNGYRGYKKKRSIFDVFDFD